MLLSCGCYPQLLCQGQINASALQVEVKILFYLFSKQGINPSVLVNISPLNKLHSNAQTAAACKCSGTFTCVLNLLRSSGTRGVQGCRERIPFSAGLLSRCFYTILNSCFDCENEGEKICPVETNL